MVGVHGGAEGRGGCVGEKKWGEESGQHWVDSPKLADNMLDDDEE